VAGVFVVSSVLTAASMPFVPGRDRLEGIVSLLVLAMIVHLRPSVVLMVAR
jgi:hypothetical protein